MVNTFGFLKNPNLLNIQISFLPRFLVWLSIKPPQGSVLLRFDLNETLGLRQIRKSDKSRTTHLGNR